MEAWELNPYIRYMDQRKCSASYDEPLYAYDYRLFAVKNGMCEAEVEGRQIKLYQDSIVIISPGSAYRLIFESQRPAVLYDVNFTLRYLPGKPMHPDAELAFHPEQMPEKPAPGLFMPFAVIYGSESICQTADFLLKVYEKREALYEERCSAILKGILLECLCASPKLSDTDEIAVRIARFLEEHCREQLDGKKIGEAFGYHPFYLNRVFRARFGTTMHRFQTECRIRRASSMLLNTRLTIKEIADSLGFSEGPYFSEVFRTATGVTPTQYRAQALCTDREYKRR